MMKPNRGFTLVELLVVIAIISVMGVFMTDIFFRSLQASNRAQILSQIKQNGQTAMEKMEKDIRDADAVVCHSTDTIMIDMKGVYLRYRFIPQVAVSTNGMIKSDNPPRDTLNPCVSGASPQVEASTQTLTNSNPLNGVSIKNGRFERSQQAGFKDTVTIKFDIYPAINVPTQIYSQITAVTLTTTVVLR